MICIVFLLALSAAQQATANGTLISVDSTITLVNLVRAPIDTFPTVPYQEVTISKWNIHVQLRVELCLLGCSGNATLS